MKSKRVLNAMTFFKHPRSWSKIHLLLVSAVIFVGLSPAAFAAESLQNLYRTPAPPPKGVTIFVAREIVTMSPFAKSATAVAVRDGRIIDVGDKAELLARFKNSKGLTVGETFSKKVITPGLIDALLSAFNRPKAVWAAEILTNVIRINHDDMEARNLKAEAYREFAYTLTNVNWRNWSLAAVDELEGKKFIVV